MEKPRLKEGLNINFNLLVENMLAHSIVAQRRVYDYINGSGSIPHVLDLRISCINTHSKYKEYKKEEAADKSKEDEKKKKKEEEKKRKCQTFLLLCQ